MNTVPGPLPFCSRAQTLVKANQIVRKGKRIRGNTGVVVLYMLYYGVTTDYFRFCMSQHEM